MGWVTAEPSTFTAVALPPTTAAVFWTAKVPALVTGWDGSNEIATGKATPDAAPWTVRAVEAAVPGALRTLACAALVAAPEGSGKDAALTV